METRQDNLTKLINEKINDEVNKAIEAELVGVAQRVEQAVRGKVGDIVARVAQHFSYENFKNEVRITVKFE